MEKKTTIISIPQCVASHTLKSLTDNNITCQYEGVDQSGRIVMKINYLSDQHGFLRKLNKDMEEGEESINFLLEISGLILINEIANAKASIELAQIKKKDGNK